MSNKEVLFIFIIYKSFGGLDTQKVINDCDFNFEKVARSFQFIFKKLLEEGG